MIGTPIGNLGDLSPRAGRILAEVQAVVAEDTRVTRKLLSHLGIRSELLSCHAHSPPEQIERLADRLDSGDLALVSDAGTPAVSDPGARLVARARARGHEVRALPGPSAVTAALSISGLPADRYRFLGFLPRRQSERQALLKRVAEEADTLVAFEAPHRLRASLKDLAALLGGDRQLALARELSKRHEELWFGSLDEARAEWATREPRGELTLVIAGAPEVEIEPWDDDRARSALRRMRAEGLGAKEASRRLAEVAGRPARELYGLWDHDAPEPESER